MKKAIESRAAGVPPLLLRQISLDDAAVSALKLLYCSCPKWVWEEGFCDVRLFALVDVADAGIPSPAASALTVDVDRQTVELERFFVHPGFPQAGTTARLISGVADRLRAAGATRLRTRKPDDARQLEQLVEVGFRRSPGAPGWMELAL
jgi:hypothetical protein